MIKWLFNGNPVDLHAAEYKIEDQLQLSVLTVKSFQPSSVGVYQCLVSNQYGADISSTILYGKGENNLFILLKYFAGYF